jgi:hypothetical protein
VVGVGGSPGVDFVNKKGKKLSTAAMGELYLFIGTKCGRTRKRGRHQVTITLFLSC